MERPSGLTVRAMLCLVAAVHLPWAPAMAQVVVTVEVVRTTEGSQG